MSCLYPQIFTQTVIAYNPTSKQESKRILQIRLEFHGGVSRLHKEQLLYLSMVHESSRAEVAPASLRAVVCECAHVLAAHGDSHVLGSCGTHMSLRRRQMRWRHCESGPATKVWEKDDTVVAAAASAHLDGATRKSSVHNDLHDNLFGHTSQAANYS